MEREHRREHRIQCEQAGTKIKVLGRPGKGVVVDVHQVVEDAATRCVIRLGGQRNHTARQRIHRRIHGRIKQCRRRNICILDRCEKAARLPHEIEKLIDRLLNQRNLRIQQRTSRPRIDEIQNRLNARQNRRRIEADGRVQTRIQIRIGGYHRCGGTGNIRPVQGQLRIWTRSRKPRHPERHQRGAVKNRCAQRRERIGQQLRDRDLAIRIVIIDQRQGDRCGCRAAGHSADRRRAAQIDGCEPEGGRRVEIARHPEADRCLTVRPLDDVEPICRHRHIPIRNAELHARLGIAG